ncbi:hypothetical protein H8E88_02290 [candidate division KSB1 bacterium]|nr:hypothetical protein [candidate division KSB1 bacterium]
MKVEKLQWEQDVDTEIVKAKIILSDGSNLRVSESIVDDKLVSYSYYWLDERNRLIIGWDNAPHHKDIKTFPHHKHIRKKTKVTESDECSLSDVLRFIFRILEQ